MCEHYLYLHRLLERSVLTFVFLLFFACGPLFLCCMRFTPDFIFFVFHGLRVMAKLAATGGTPPEAQVAANLGRAYDGYRVSFPGSDTATVQRRDEFVLTYLLDQIKFAVRERLRRLNGGTFPHCLLLLSIGTGSPDQVPRTANPKPSARSRSLSLMHCIHMLLIHCLMASSLPSRARNRTVPSGARRRDGLGLSSARSQPETTLGR